MTTEEILFREMARAHLETGHHLVFRGCEWTRIKDGEEVSYMRGDGDEWAEWLDASDAVDNLIGYAHRYKRDIDEVEFHDSDKTGVTWRFLKLDMPFLRIVLKKDAKVIGSITERLSAILRANLEEKNYDPERN